MHDDNPIPPQNWNDEMRRSVGDAVRWLKHHKIKGIIGGVMILFFLQYLSLPNYSLQSLRKINPVTTAMMEQRKNEAAVAGKKFVLRKNWIPLRKISKHLVNAVVISEDGMFFTHEGIDWYELGESIEKNFERGRAARGGSTISQQLSKNLYLSTSKDPVRKLKEMIITVRMERVLSKRRILEIYLNVIEWGNGIFGAEAAAKYYFKKSAAQLTREEAAQMAAVIPNPRRYQPNVPSRYVTRRSAVILSRMSARGM